MSDDIPPPPPPPPEGVPFTVPTPAMGPPRRPSVLTTAGIVLIVEAALVALGGALLLSLSGDTMSSSLRTAGIPQYGKGFALILLVVAAAEFLAGVLILRLRPAGRILGLVVAALGALSGLGSLAGGRGSAVINLGINIFLIYALTTTGDVFARSSRG